MVRQRMPFASVFAVVGISAGAPDEFSDNLDGRIQ
jgi:hypothetical protein